MAWTPADTLRAAEQVRRVAKWSEFDLRYPSEFDLRYQRGLRDLAPIVAELDDLEQVAAVEWCGNHVALAFVLMRRTRALRRTYANDHRLLPEIDAVHRRIESAMTKPMHELVRAPRS